MAIRHRNALLIQLGAVNPQAIARAIVAACEEMRNEPTFKGTDHIRQDPAVRLMVHQLAFLCGTREIDDTNGVYRRLIEACESGNGI